MMNQSVSIAYVNDTGKTDFSVYVSGMPYVSSDPSSFVAWQTLRSQSTAAFLFPATAGVGLIWEGVTYGPKITPSTATWEVSTTRDMEPVIQQVPHKASSGSLVLVKNLTKLSQLTIGIFKGKRIFLAKKNVQPDRIYRFSVTANVFFNAGYGGDVQGQNFRVNIADFEDGVVVVVKCIDDEFVFTAASPDIARSMFRKEDQHALLATTN